MHTIHDPRKTIVNPHNRVGIIEYIIHYITSSNSDMGTKEEVKPNFRTPPR
jgi:hypothetical protein